MELVMWIVIGIVAVLGFIVLVPVLVVGGWYVVITVIMGLADGAIWLLDEGWRTIRGRKSRAEVQTKPPVDTHPVAIHAGQGSAAWT